MKKLSVGMCLMTLLVAAGCGGSDSEKPETAAPAARQPSPQPVRTVARKPVAGEAEHTFSLSVPFKRVDLAQGEQQPVRIGINRGENFGEDVAIKVSGLPAGVTVDADEPVITQGSTGVVLTLKAASDAALGDFTFKVTGQTASSGADFSEEIELTVAQK